MYLLNNTFRTISIYLEVIINCKKVYEPVVDGTHGTNY